MSLRTWSSRVLGAGSPVPPAEPAPPAIPPCPSCPSNDFAVGATTLAGAPIVTCMGCGARWYLCAGAWRKPHEKALPAAWAQMEALSRMEAQQAEIAQNVRRTTNGEQLTPRRRAPHEGFRRPPAVED